MLQIEDRAWVEQALKFWTSRKPDRHTSRRIIKWNVEELTAALKRLNAPKSNLTPAFYSLAPARFATASSFCAMRSARLSLKVNFV
jgi:hypothetical protein